MGKYSGENAPNVILVLMFMPFVGATIGILTSLISTGIIDLVEKRREKNA